MLVFRVKFDYLNDNGLHFTEAISVGFRFSLWKDNSNFTAGEIIEISSGGVLTVGKTYIMTIKLIYSNVSSELRMKDNVFIGVPYNEIGTIEVLEQLEDIVF